MSKRQPDPGKDKAAREARRAERKAAWEPKNAARRSAWKSQVLAELAEQAGEEV